MHKHLLILGRLTGRSFLPKLLMSTLVVGLSMTGSWAQETYPGWSAASVGESFSAFQQALSSTANDLLARAQRPSPMPRSERSLPAAPLLQSGAASLTASQEEGSIHIRQALQRVQALRPMLEPILREEGVPPQMSAVILVESGGRTTALSSKGARGLWQIMPDTARRYGLVVNSALDERLDPYNSTRAAARYLRDLYTRFGDWPLALAAYNVGEDAVQRAIDRTSDRDFNSLVRAGMLPLETQNYVPSVLSAMRMIGAKGVSYVTTVGVRTTVGVVYAIDRVEG
jgi:soluble lytic murein transglycosylase-like protein